MDTTKTPIELEAFQGHIVLYCKGHYKHDDFFEGLKMIWAIRCGYDYEYTSKDTLSYIAMDMYEIIAKTQPDRLPYLMEQLHRNLVPRWKGDYVENLSPIEAIIWQYRIMLCNMQVKERDNVTGKYKWLVKLPKPKKRIFNRILRGNGEYHDYFEIDGKAK
jgi:hypothetical protein